MNQIKRLIIVSLGLSAVMFGMHAAQEDLTVMSFAAQQIMQFMHQMAVMNYSDLQQLLQPVAQSEQLAGASQMFLLFIQQLEWDALQFQECQKKLRYVLKFKLLELQYGIQKKVNEFNQHSLQVLQQQEECQILRATKQRLCRLNCKALNTRQQ